MMPRAFVIPSRQAPALRSASDEGRDCDRPARGTRRDSGARKQRPTSRDTPSRRTELTKRVDPLILDTTRPT